MGNGLSNILKIPHIPGLPGFLQPSLGGSGLMPDFINKLPQKIVDKILKALGMSSVADFLTKVENLPAKTVTLLEKLAKQIGLNQKNLVKDAGLIEHSIESFIDIIIALILNSIKIIEISLKMITKAEPLLSTLLYLTPLLANTYLIFAVFTRLSDIDLGKYNFLKPYINGVLIGFSAIVEFQYYNL